MYTFILLNNGSLKQGYEITEIIKNSQSEDGYSHITMRELSEKLQIPVKQISNLIYWLNKSGFLEVKKTNTGNKYRLKEPFLEREEKSGLYKDSEKIYKILQAHADQDEPYRTVISQRDIVSLSEFGERRITKCIDYLYYSGKILCRPMGCAGTEYILMDKLQEEVFNNEIR